MVGHWQGNYDWVEFEAATSAPDGATYAAGRGSHPTQGYDIVIMKHQPDGTRGWVRTYASPTQRDEQGWAVATSKAGIVVVTGRERGATGSWNVITVAWSKSGTRLWVKRLMSPDGSDCGGRDVLVTGAGAVYVTGRLGRADKAEDLFLARYTKSGTLLWKKYVDGSDGFTDYDSGDALAMDGRGMLYVAGSVTNTTTGRDLALVKYRPDGRRVWSRSWDSAEATDEWANDLAIRGSFVVMAGGAVDGAGETCGIVARADTSGRLHWERVQDAAAATEAEYTHVGVDAYCHTLVAGWKDFKTGNGKDAFYARYEPSGDFDWSDYRMGPGDTEDVANGLAVTAEGEAYVGGVQAGVMGYDVFAERLQPSGMYRWLGWYTATPAAQDGALALSLGLKGVCLAGRTDDAGLMLMYAKDVATP